MPSTQPADSLLIVWHSRTGASRALARAAQAGARLSGACMLIEAERTQPDDLLAASGYIFICPENLASMSGAMKEFFDRCYYSLLGKIEGRPFATIIAAGSDGRGADAQIARIATGWRLRRVAEPMIVVLDAQTEQAILAEKSVPPEKLKAASDLGQALCEGISHGIF